MVIIDVAEVRKVLRELAEADPRDPARFSAAVASAKALVQRIRNAPRSTVVDMCGRCHARSADVEVDGMLVCAACAPFRVLERRRLS